MTATDHPATTGPFDSVRDYIAALEAYGRLLRIPEIDQDKYEATALAYRLADRYGWVGGPTVCFDRVHLGGEWFDGPVIINQYGGWDCEALAFGAEPVPGDQLASFFAAMDKVAACRDDEGKWRRVPPVEINLAEAPCRDVIIRGDDVNLLGYPFLQNNPVDGGRYINTGCVICEDPEVGRNVGIYRCQVKGPRSIALSSGAGQGGWDIIMQAQQRGEPFASVAIALGADPIVYAMGGSKVAMPGEDELEFAGGFRGRPVEIVRCETSALSVPAHAEMIIEGRVYFGFTREGPYGERYGYAGAARDDCLLMEVDAVTHRRRPWFFNQFTGIMRGSMAAPGEVSMRSGFSQWFPEITGMHCPDPYPGWCYVSVNKSGPGQVEKLGEQIAKYLPNAKIIVVVDDDVEIHRPEEVLHAIGTRWQPHPAGHIVEEGFSLPLDPSLPERLLNERVTSSKIVIDATRQWPEEGGPEVYAKLSRECLTEALPEVFAGIDARLDGLIGDWRP